MIFAAQPIPYFHFSAIEEIENNFNTSDPHVPMQLAERYCSTGDYLVAEKTIMFLIDEENQNSHLLYLMGRIYVELLDFESAFSFWGKIDSPSSDLTEMIKTYRKTCALHWLALVMDEFGPVKTWLNRVVELSPDSKWAADVLGELWLKAKTKILRKVQSKNSDRIIDCWEPIKNIFPEWFYLKGWNLREKNKAEEALPYLERAVRLASDRAEWMVMLARTLIELGHFDDGLEKLRQAVKIAPQSALLWEELGDVLYDEGDFSAAAMAYENCFIALPQQTDVMRKYGDCYLAMDEPDAAKEAYIYVLKHEPGNMDAGLNLEKANKK